MQRGPQCVLKHFNTRNAVPMRSDSFSTMESAFLRVLPRNDPGWLTSCKLQLASLQLNTLHGSIKGHLVTKYMYIVFMCTVQLSQWNDWTENEHRRQMHKAHTTEIRSN